MFKKDTLKSKTFWGLVAGGVVNALGIAGAIPLSVLELANVIIFTFTGVSAVDRTTKMIEATRDQR